MTGMYGMRVLGCKHNDDEHGRASLTSLPHNLDCGFPFWRIVLGHVLPERFQYLGPLMPG